MKKWIYWCVVKIWLNRGVRKDKKEGRGDDNKTIKTITTTTTTTPITTTTTTYPVILYYHSTILIISSYCIIFYKHWTT